VTDGYVFGASLYKYVGASVSFAAAEAACSSWGPDGHVVSIGSQLEQSFVFGLKPGAMLDPIWLGAQRNRSLAGLVFEWTDGSPFNYSNWRAGEPNDFGGAESCVTMGKVVMTTMQYSMEWNDARCNFAVPYICERPMSGGAYIA
jgi:hypothetical protein